MNQILSRGRRITKGAWPGGGGGWQYHLSELTGYATLNVFPIKVDYLDDPLMIL